MIHRWMHCSILTGKSSLSIQKAGIGCGSVVRCVTATQAKPHGLDYSLTLHGPGGERLVGFDNAHPVRRLSGRRAKAANALDHRHRLKSVRPYVYNDAAALLADFWTAVDEMLRHRGVIR